MALLSEYDRKRNFTRTPEPRGLRRKQVPSHRFVVQWHKARRDHFDFRLELDGVLKSWAVTRGPSAKPATKRLAVRTEDHPIDYADFEGVIPEGAYGAGPVMLWDEGTWHSESPDPQAALAEGALKFVLSGSRMKGRWALIRLKPEGKRENWLLIKDRDEFAEDDDSLATRFETSVRSDRTFDDLLEKRKTPKRKVTSRAGTRARVPDFVPPLLCKSALQPPAGDEWLYEMKYDGYRLQAAVADGKAVIRTRKGLDWTDRFPTIADAIGRLSVRSAVIDGEAVVLDRNGVADFPALVRALKEGNGAPVVYMAFDLLELDGKDLRKKPLAERRQMLEKVLNKSGAKSTVRLATAVTSDPADVLAAITKAGGEGIIAKRASAPYVSGRSAVWIKVKAKRRDDAVVVGWYPSDRGGRRLASLAIAFPSGRKLKYAGRVGTGFNVASEASMIEALAPLAASGPPANLDTSLVPKGIRWVKPSMTVAITYSARTHDGLLRGATFLGVREDDGAREIEPEPEPIERAAKGGSRKSAASGKVNPTSREPAKMITITHASRVVFPATGMTKGDVAAYYERVAPHILPYLEDRPVSLIRAPDNIEGETFFQRHPMPAMKAGIVRVPSPERREQPYMAIDGAAGLRTVVQFGGIELHGWGARLPKLEAPDRVVIDLDPGDDVPFERVREAALLVRRILESAGLKSFPLATGGKGVHVVAPLDRSQTWDDIESFTSGISRMLAAREPSQFIAKASKAQRKGRIYIDWLRNKLTATAIVPYSLRAKPDAPLALPLSWPQLTKLERSGQFLAATLKPGRDPWAAYFKTRQRIPKRALDLLRKQGSL
jgi:bifunctional non-homologous end joining protein LigD